MEPCRAVVVVGERRGKNGSNHHHHQQHGATNQTVVNRPTNRRSPRRTRNNDDTPNGGATTPTLARRTGMVANNRALIATTNLNQDTTSGGRVTCPSEYEEQHDKGPAAGGATCIICHEKAPICIVMPCMHLSYCVACTRSMCCNTEGQPKHRSQFKCAKCRQPIHSAARVFAE